MQLQQVILLISAIFVNVACAQHLRYTMYESGSSCNGVGHVCNNLQSGQCCSLSDHHNYASANTDLWTGVLHATRVKVTGLSKYGNYCGSLINSIRRDECFHAPSPRTISGGMFTDGVWFAEDEELESCTSVHPIDEYVFKVGEVRYSISAHNQTHAAVMASASAEEKARYILDNFETREVTSTDGRVTMFSVQG